MTDTELLEEIKRHIPAFMESDLDASLLQAFFYGHAEGVRLERQKCLEVVDELANEALEKMVREMGRESL